MCVKTFCLGQLFVQSKLHGWAGMCVSAQLSPYKIASLPHHQIPTKIPPHDNPNISDQRKGLIKRTQTVMAGGGGWNRKLRR